MMRIGLDGVISCFNGFFMGQSSFVPAFPAFDCVDVGRDFIAVEFIFFTAAITPETNQGIYASGRFKRFYCRFFRSDGRRFFFKFANRCDVSCAAQRPRAGGGFTIYNFFGGRNFIFPKTMALTTVLADNFNGLDWFG